MSHWTMAGKSHKQLCAYMHWLNQYFMFQINFWIISAQWQLLLNITFKLITYIRNGRFRLGLQTDYLKIWDPYRMYILKILPLRSAIIWIRLMLNKS